MNKSNSIVYLLTNAHFILNENKIGVHKLYNQQFSPKNMFSKLFNILQLISGSFHGKIIVKIKMLLSCSASPADVATGVSKKLNKHARLATRTVTWPSPRGATVAPSVWREPVGVVYVA